MREVKSHELALVSAAATRKIFKAFSTAPPRLYLVKRLYFHCALLVI